MVHRGWVLFGILLTSAEVVLCVQYGSLGFVIDNTNSMAKEISLVRNAVDGIMDIIQGNPSSQIKDVVLVTFNDPTWLVDSSYKTGTRDELKQSLDSIRFNGGGDCPEYSMAGVLRALEKSRSNSYLFVFTDAPPKDPQQAERVKRVARTKETQIIFVKTVPSGEECKRIPDSDYHTYYEIAAHTLSPVFNCTNKQEVEDILNYVRWLISGGVSIIEHKVIPPNTPTVIPFTVDDQTENVMVSATGTNVKLDIRGPTNRNKFVRTTWIKNAKKIQINNPEPGEHKAIAEGTSYTTILMSVRTDFTFQHGFSENEPATFNNDRKQPTDGTQYHLLVNVTDPSNSVKIKTAEIYTEDGTFNRMWPLKRKSGGYYVTDKFLPPSTTFFIAINGVGKYTLKAIKRRANTPIDIRPRNSDPVITIVGSNVLGYNEKLHLTCNVKAYPKPKIYWLDESGKNVPEQFQKQYGIDRYHSARQLTMENMKKSTRYTCYAENAHGDAPKHVDVHVMSPFLVGNKQYANSKELEYGKPATLHCDITSSFPMQIIWTLNGNAVSNSDQHSITKGGTELQISKATEAVEGTYKCKAWIINDSGTTHELVHVVKTNGLAPVMDSSKHLFVTEGKTVTLKCNVLRAHPPPSITWQFQKTGESVFHNLAAIGTELTVSNANVENAGIYKCIAQNSKDAGQQDTKLSVTISPKITLLINNAEASSKNVKYGEALSIVCRVTASHLSSITWNNAAQTSLSQNTFNDPDKYHYTSELKTTMKTSDTIFCRASNSQGYHASKSVIVTVQSPFVVGNKHPSSTNATQVEYDKPSTLYCDITSSFPMKLIWTLNEKTIENSQQYSIVNGGTELRISKLTEADEGMYKCKALIVNDEKTAHEIVHNVRVGNLAPIMGTSQWVSVKENHAVTLNCNVIRAYPAPNITWQFKKTGETTFKNLTTVGADLTVSNANVENAGIYKCIALNSKDAGYQETKLDVLFLPKITLLINNTEVSNLAVKYRDTVTLICRVTASNLSKIMWKNEANDTLLIDPFRTSDLYNYMSTLNVTIKKSDKISCLAENSQGNAKKSVDVTMQSPFVVKNKQSATSVQAEYDKASTLHCDITSSFSMKIIWTFNGTTIENSQQYSIVNAGTELRISKLTEADEGRYKCKALIVNDEKTAHEIVHNVRVGNLAPIMGTSQWVSVKENHAVTLNCNVIRAYPAPNITWQFRKTGETTYKNLTTVGADLTVSNANVENAGIYKCIALNSKDAGYQETKLDVLFLPKITLLINNTEVSNLAVKYRDSVTLICRVTASNLSKIMWKNEADDTLLIDPFRTPDLYYYTSTLNVTIKKSDKISCLAENSQGNAKKSVDVTMQSPFVVKNKQSATSVQAEYDKASTLHCDITSSFSMKIIWTFNGTTIENSQQYSIVNEGTELRISKLTEADEGMYKCKALIVNDEKTAHEVVHNVKVVNLAPQMGKTERVHVKEKNSVTIDCNILRAYPAPHITWQFKRTGETIFKDIAAVGNVPKLTISNAALQNSGIYRCIAKNSGGVGVKEAHLVVGISPRVKILINDAEVAETNVKYGETVLIFCRITSHEYPDVVWKNGKQEIIKVDKTDTVKVFEFISLLRISSFRKNDTYTCEASNNVNKVSKKVHITADNPLKLINPSSTAATNIRYGDKATIKCGISTAFPTKYSWTLLDKSGKTHAIDNSEKYSLSKDGSELTINRMDVGLEGQYECKAALIDDAGVHRNSQTTVKLELELPQVEIQASVLKVRVGTNAVMKCKIIKGNPQPKLKWEMKDKQGKEKILSGTEELVIKNVKYEDAGFYKCEAISFAGHHDKTVQLIVQGPPVILSDEDKIIYGVEGDVSLRIPCDVEGFPQPSISWIFGGKPIVPDDKYSMENGVLIINNPVVKGDGDYSEEKYICVAKNDLGEASKSFSAIMSKNVDEDTFGNLTYIYMKTGETRELRCTSGSESSRWYHDSDNYTAISTTYTLTKVTEENDGNYTCRVSSKDGSYSHTYVVDVGYKPTFETDQSLDFDWEGDSTSLDCSVKMKPNDETVKVEWIVNGKVSPTHNYSHDVKDWGTYTCKISNVHGEVSRTFEVKSSRCLLLLEKSNSPLILDSSGSWPELVAETKYFAVENDAQLYLTCHNQTNKANSFKVLPQKNAIEAVCKGQDKLLVENKIYNFADLECQKDVEPVIKHTGNACGSKKNGELIKVGYEVDTAEDEFLEVYTACFDKSEKVVLNTQMTMKRIIRGSPLKDDVWQKSDKTYSSGNQEQCDDKSTCCLRRTQLVNSQDVQQGAPQLATYIEGLNSVPVWDSCNRNVSWSLVEEKIRKFLLKTSEFKTVTGVHDYNNGTGVMVPRFLWKYIRRSRGKESAREFVIVRVNDPSPTEDNIRCSDFGVKTPCSDFGVYLPEDQYTYCCNSSEFNQYFSTLRSI